MTDLMPEPAVDLDQVLGEDPPVPAGGLDVVDEQLIARLAGRAREGGLALTGEGGLLAQLTKRLVESALEGEITDHLGYDRHDAAGRDGGNSRNGHRSKTVLTEVGPVEIDVPRDRDGSFEPKIVAKRQRRLSGVDELVLSLRVGADVQPRKPGDNPLYHQVRRFPRLVRLPVQIDDPLPDPRGVAVGAHRGVEVTGIGPGLSGPVGVVTLEVHVPEVRQRLGLPVVVAEFGADRNEPFPLGVSQRG